MPTETPSSIPSRRVALKLFAGKGHTKAYPTTEELLLFGSKVCGVAKPALVLARIAEGMQKTLDQAGGDQRIPKDLLEKMRDTWTDGMTYAKAVP